MMTDPPAGAVCDLFIVRNFFDAQTCARLVAEMRSAQGAAATVYRGAATGVVDDRVRRVTRVVPAPETGEFVTQRLLERRAEIERHFRVVAGGCEEPQFLRYRVGDFFVAHQDGNTGLIRLDLERVRTVSLIIFLNDEAEEPSDGSYCGGSLVFHGRSAGTVGRQFALRGEAGTLVAFRPETTHEITPVTHGERYSVACWYK